jgi:adenosylcobinamide-GDP ribazoletransferase
MSDSPDDDSASAPPGDEAVEVVEQQQMASSTATPATRENAVEQVAPVDAAGNATAPAAGAAHAYGDRRFDFTRWVLQIRLTASFLTILPVGPANPASTAEVAASFGWFPLVGFGIGLVLCAIDWMLTPVFGNAMRAVLIVLILTVLTGGLHLDGLADTADALGAGRDRTRVLEILRDSRIGSFGTIALVFVIVLKVFALAGADGAQRYAAIYVATGLGRWAMVALASGLDYLRLEGAGAAMLSRDRRRNLRVATITAAIAMVPLVTLHALRACVVAALVTLALRSSYRRWVGGVTGDLIGAAGEIVETAVLIAVTL